MNSEMKRNPIDIVCLSNKQTFSFLFLLIGFLLIPQMSYSQFKDSCFNLTRDGETAEVKINNTFTTDTIIMPEINERISGLSVSGYVHLNDGDESYVKIIYDVDKKVYAYSVQIIEEYSGNRKGLKLTAYDEIIKLDAKNKITTTGFTSSTSTGCTIVNK